jgi:hypothetical protein
MAGHRASYVHSLHQRYGPVVRIGPNELSFATAEAAHDIYIGVSDPVGDPKGTVKPTPTTTKLKTFPKSALYDAVGRNVTLFKMRDEAQHRVRLKHIGHCYSASLLHHMEPVMRNYIALLLTALEERRGTPLNMLHWFRMVAFDVIGAKPALR